jgi:hypothetical protein
MREPGPRPTLAELQRSVALVGAGHDPAKFRIGLTTFSKSRG